MIDEVSCSEGPKVVHRLRGLEVERGAVEHGKSSLEALICLLEAPRARHGLDESWAMKNANHSTMVQVMKRGQATSAMV